MWLDIEKQRLHCEEQCIENYKKLLEVKKTSYQDSNSSSDEESKVWQQHCSSKQSDYYCDEEKINFQGSFSSQLNVLEDTYR